jgi:nucleoid-associated protein YgaU
MALSALKKLKIRVEKPGGVLQFDDSNVIPALFNPEKLVFSKTANWAKQGAAQRDNPELQFTNAEPRTLRIDLLFDTYDTPSQQKADVRRAYTDAVLHLTTVERHGDKHRPPVCQLSWGAAGVIFQGVLTQLQQQIILFMDDGTPVRAKLSCTFKEWRSNSDDMRRQRTSSSDVTKSRTVKRGETLSSIAAEELDDAANWRPIADANDLDDPGDLRPGMVLLIPRLRGETAPVGGAS